MGVNFVNMAACASHVKLHNYSNYVCLLRKCFFFFPVTTTTVLHDLNAMENFLQYLKMYCFFLIYSMIDVQKSQLHPNIPVCVLQDRTMFTIPWKHAARHGWEVEKDASLFKSWAVHTGVKAYSHKHASFANNKKEN